MSELVSGLASLGINLLDETARQENLFLDEMMHWNKRINLTSIRDHAEAIERHLIDSLVLLPFIGLAQNLLDMGSGGGVPGIPLAISCPELQVISVDSVGKKINFQKHVKRKLKLENLQPIQSRLENLAECLDIGDRFDLIVARAFSSLDVIVSLAKPWLQDRGKLLVMKGPEGVDELSEYGSKVEESGFISEEIYQYQLPFSRAKRQLIVLAINTA